MGKYTDLFALLGNYQVAKHARLAQHKAIERERLVSLILESTTMAGYSLTKEMIDSIMTQGVQQVTPTNHDQLMVAGYQDAFMLVQRLVADQIELSENIVKELHSLLFVGSSEDFRGQYRTDYITVPHAKNLPPVRHISYFMSKLFDEYKEPSNMDMIERIAWFHVKFEGIHPFEDGNGQVGRLIINYQLMKAGYPFVVFNHDMKKRYYKALEIYQTELNLQPMVEIILEAISNELTTRINLLTNH